MTPLPDRPDLDQLRTRAKELKRALAAGDQAALDRVLASHPKYVGRPAERLGQVGLTLRDARVTIARELGFESWKALLAEVEGPTVRRWSPSADYALVNRAFREMKELETGYCTVDHFLLALLNPEQPTIALRVLNDLGVAYELVAEKSKSWHRRTK
ncbi:MAG TPA: Clp protease N-terminal domain-containing protein [Acidimicrobiia bacterium]|nr:Clp protease N-terminal domain-containing protein [Acidimicrobiia bacterium]